LPAFILFREKLFYFSRHTNLQVKPFVCHRAAGRASALNLKACSHYYHQFFRKSTSAGIFLKIFFSLSIWPKTVCGQAERGTWERRRPRLRNAAYTVMFHISAKPDMGAQASSPAFFKKMRASRPRSQGFSELAS